MHDFRGRLHDFRGRLHGFRGRLHGFRGRTCVMLPSEEAAVATTKKNSSRKPGGNAKAAGRPFDIVILDLTIRGGMGGAETVRKLLEIDPDAKTVVSSGYSDDLVTSTYRKHGFRAFLKKPYDVTDLQAILNALLV